MSTNRRSFLKFIGLGGLMAPAVGALDIVSKHKPTKEEQDFLVKEWADEGITYLEYEFPPSFQAMFKTQDRKRAVYCPIRRINVIAQKELINIEKSQEYHIDGGQIYENTYTDVISEEKVTDALLIQQHVNYAKMHRDQRESPWLHPHVYIVRILEHPELFGIMINSERLALERDAYTVY